MHTTTTVIVIVIAIVISNILSNAWPKIPSTLIQIASGVMLALIPIVAPLLHNSSFSHFHLSLDPELFMAVIIAPLLFREAEEADLISLWKLKKPVMLMAFLLVFITVLVIGVCINNITPGMPLAACFALGAILGPTDVVAVISLSKKIEIEPRLMTIIKGEGLINDASGVIAFTYASAALLTGHFSAPVAAFEFVIETLGGVAVGIIAVSIKSFITDLLKHITEKNIATYILIDISLPFFCFFASELIGVSGIIAAVAAGSRSALSLRKLDIFEAEFHNMKNTLWEIINYVLNSLVFILLGMQLPGIVTDIMDLGDLTFRYIVVIPVVVTLILFSVRFASVIFMARGYLGDTNKEQLKSAGLLTFSGVKGTVSLATAFALPFFFKDGSVFTDRPILLYTTAMCIFLTIIPAVFILPKLGNNIKVEVDNSQKIEVLQSVVTELRKQYRTEYTSAVILYFRERITELRQTVLDKKETQKLEELRAFMEKTEQDLLHSKFNSGEITKDEYSRYLHVLDFINRIAVHSMTARIDLRFSLVLDTIKRIGFSRKRKLLKTRPRRQDLRAQIQTEMQGSMDAYYDSEDRTENETKAKSKMRYDKPGVMHYGYKTFRKLKTMFWEDTDYLIQALDAKKGDYDEALVSRVIDERIELAGYVMVGMMGSSVHAQFNDEYEAAMLRAFEVERGVIQVKLADGTIDEEIADEMRIDLNLVETYMLQEHKNSLMSQIITKARSNYKKNKA
ncbi:MAG: sodium:proton antiporter [Clostridiales Family XIII bacterium]|jgi:CPA1 family monovalent cation:H+ antiporter|nr:sodium:proton antiporter [Clostridiales Family XIII bacterium]